MESELFCDDFFEPIISDPGDEQFHITDYMDYTDEE